MSIHVQINSLKVDSRDAFIPMMLWRDGRNDYVQVESRKVIVNMDVLLTEDVLPSGIGHGVFVDRIVNALTREFEGVEVTHSSQVRRLK